MTAPARITQADIDRATKSVVNAKIAHARIIMDLKAARIEIIVGDVTFPAVIDPADLDPRQIWSDDDV